MGLVVDKYKRDSKNGNTVRTFFDNLEKLAKITSLDKD